MSQQHGGRGPPTVAAVPAVPVGSGHDCLLSPISTTLGIHGSCRSGARGIHRRCLAVFSVALATGSTSMVQEDAEHYGVQVGDQEMDGWVGWLDGWMLEGWMRVGDAR